MWRGREGGRKSKVAVSSVGGGGGGSEEEERVEEGKRGGGGMEREVRKGEAVGREEGGGRRMGFGNKTAVTKR